MDLSQITSFLQLVSSFLVAITGIVSVIIGIIRPLRKWLMKQLGNRDQVNAIENKVDHLDKLLDEDRKEQLIMKEAFVCLTRNALTEIWHKAQEDGYISDWDRENFEEMYLAYTALGGNHYIHEAHEQILKLPPRPPVKKTVRRKTTRKTTKKKG